MNGDASNPSAVHIFNAASKSWSTQAVTTGTFDPSSFTAILDHDTNVFYALSKGELFFLDMGSLTSANSSAVSWTDVEKSPYGDTYQPVMAIAQNHIHFLDVPGTPTGDADIFVIHCRPILSCSTSHAHNSNSLLLPARSPGVPDLGWWHVPCYPRSDRIILPGERGPAGIRLHSG